MLKRIVGVVAMVSFVMPAAASAVAGSPYVPGTLGYDISFATRSYPSWFNFAIFSVTRGKAFRYNERLMSEHMWAKFASSTSAPTLYMNLNAPYGSTVTGHVDAPKSCPPMATSTATNGEPNACEGYNYGYNAAKDAYAYAKKREIESSLWWLDIEEANSWSDTVAVNDATIQGAIDYLNSEKVRVGIYSMPYMWKRIAGSTFVPAQVLEGRTVTTPLWLPVGIKTQIGAQNTCITTKGFIPGSPLWLVQYVANAKAIDQNVAC